MAADLAAQSRKIRKLQAQQVAIRSQLGGLGLILERGGENTRITRASGTLAPPLPSSYPPPGTGGPNDPYGPLPPGGEAFRDQTINGINVGEIIDYLQSGKACELMSAGTTARKICDQVAALLGLSGARTGDKSRPAGLGPCPEGQFRMGEKCVDPTAVLPGGDPFTSPAGGVAVAGSFGMPAIQPAMETRVRRSCPAGMVLGKDNLCYPRQILPRRSNFRKWKAPRRPPISVRDAQAIRRAERAKSRVKSLAKDVGFSVKKR